MGAVNASVILVVQYIGNTFWLVVHTFAFPSGSRRRWKLCSKTVDSD